VRPTKRTPKRREAFLAALETTANVSRACRMAHLPRQCAYEWRDADEEFAKAWEEALERGTDALEDEAVRRAYQGVLKPVYQGGKKVGTVREYSDTLLIFMLKARRPEKFKERIEHGVTADLAERLEAARRRALSPPTLTLIDGKAGEG
jgi:hypothetical protein